jgi:hypothetical protein
MASDDCGSGGSGRRSFLQTTAGLVGGAAALAACGPGASAVPAAPDAPPAGTIRPGGRVLLASGRVIAPAPTDAELDPAAIAFGGPLLDPKSGDAVGSFRAQAAENLGAGSELQTLKLPEGTLFAVGERSGGRSGTYAIVGGTDAFVGARGTCVVRPLSDGAVRSELELTISLS